MSGIIQVTDVEAFQACARMRRAIQFDMAEAMCRLEVVESHLFPLR